MQALAEAIPPVAGTVAPPAHRRAATHVVVAVALALVVLSAVFTATGSHASAASDVPGSRASTSVAAGR